MFSIKQKGLWRNFLDRWIRDGDGDTLGTVSAVACIAAGEDISRILSGSNLMRSRLFIYRTNSLIKRTGISILAGP